MNDWQDRLTPPAPAGSERPSLEEWRRLEALKAAVAALPNIVAPKGVLGVAREFEAYLRGDNS